MDLHTALQAIKVSYGIPIQNKKKMKEYKRKKKKCDISYSSKYKFLKIFTSTNILCLNRSTKDGLKKKIIILSNIFVEIQNIIYSKE